MVERCFVYCGVVLSVLVSAGFGTIFFYYGNSCKNVELRANHTHVCKDIHNDDSAKALQAFGWIFVAPFLIVVVAASFFVMIFVMFLPCILCDMFCGN